MNYTIREVKNEDIKELLNVYIQGYRYHQEGRSDIFVNLSDEELEKDLINNLNELSTIVLIKDNKIVGYLSYKIKGKYKKKLDIDQLVIDENNRGQGLGKKLVEQAKIIAKENNCTRIELNCWLFNKNALSMYEHIGFERQRIIYEMSLDGE